MKIQKKYQGAIPLNRIANEYNDSQLNTYSTEYINNKLEDCVTDEQLNNYPTKEEIGKSHIMIGFPNAASSWTEDNVWVTVGFGKVHEISGTKLSCSGAGVVVGPNVKKVRILGQLTFYQCPEDNYSFLGIKINNTMKVKTIQQLGSWRSVTIETTASVKEGDIITLEVYKDTDNGERFEMNDFVSFTSAPCNFLLVETIE
jgi:hypothetical protein